MRKARKVDFMLRVEQSFYRAALRFYFNRARMQAGFETWRVVIRSSRSINPTQPVVELYFRVSISQVHVLHLGLDSQPRNTQRSPNTVQPTQQISYQSNATALYKRSTATSNPKDTLTISQLTHHRLKMYTYEPLNTSIITSKSPQT